MSEDVVIKPGSPPQGESPQEKIDQLKKEMDGLREELKGAREDYSELFGYLLERSDMLHREFGVDIDNVPPMDGKGTHYLVSWKCRFAWPTRLEALKFAEVLASALEREFDKDVFEG